MYRKEPHFNLAALLIFDFSHADSIFIPSTLDIFLALHLLTSLVCVLNLNESL